jgi:hypothetical protein
LAETAREDVRFCGSCDREVFFSESDEDTLRLAREGRCVARVEPDPGELPRVVVGRPVVVEVGEDEAAVDEARAVEARAAEAMEWRRRERGIERVLVGGGVGVDRACPGCGYPVAGFRESCLVCRHVVGRELP